MRTCLIIGYGFRFPRGLARSIDIALQNPNLEFVGRPGRHEANQKEGQPRPRLRFHQLLERFGMPATASALRTRLHSSRSLPCQKHSVGILPASLAVQTSETSQSLHCLKPCETRPCIAGRTWMSLGRSAFHNFANDFPCLRLVLPHNKSLVNAVVKVQSTVYEVFS